MGRLLAVIIIFVSLHTLAQETAPWAHESEAAVVKVGGNSTSESYSAVQKTIHRIGADSWTAAGRYQQSKASGTETAKSWEASLRYEKAFNDLWSVFVQQGAESNTYAGYLQRDNTDFGGKLNLLKSDTDSAFLEAGVRSTETLSSQGLDKKRESFGRLYTEYNRKINNSVSAKAWIEYLPNFTNSDAYFLNYSPSLTVIMSEVFSLKVAYLVKIHNKLIVANESKEDTTLTTSLVAKF